MATGIDRDLAPLETQDAFLRRAMQAMLAQLAGTAAAQRHREVQFYVCDFRFAPRPVLEGRYFSANCAALRAENAIVLNEAFLLETEAALRSFNLAGELLATPYLRSDEDLFGLVARIRADPHAYVERLRALDRLPGRDGADAQAVEQFSMLLLFLVGHELGHLAQGHDQRAFGAFVDPAAPLETRVGNAVVKLGRHAREFARFGFDLPLFEQATDEHSEVGANEKQWRETLKDLDFNHARWFDDEAGADGEGAALVQEVLDGLAATDAAASDRRLVGLVEALFATALYHWQRDLASFLEKLQLGRLTNAQHLVLAMMQRREHYIHAASLFGDVHRFTLLRAILAIDQWLHARGVVEQPLDKPVRRIAAAAVRQALDPDNARECWRRKLLLQIHLDTAIKIAYVGSITGWMLNAEQLRGTPQLFMMQFESIRSAVARLRKLV